MSLVDMLHLSAKLLLMLAFLAVSNVVSAQWTVEVWSPGGQAGTGFASRSAGSIGGRIGSRATLWNESLTTQVDLQPESASASWLWEIADDIQVGGTYSSNAHAAMWRGAASSFHDLNPFGADSSEATGISGDQIVGVARFRESQFVLREEPTLWDANTRQSVSLLPSSATDGFAWGADSGTQVGWLNTTLGTKAVLWNGTADSWQDITPSGRNGQCFGIGGNQIVGISESSAALWYGSDHRWENLHPPQSGDPYSVAFSVGYGIQVGWTTEIGGQADHACLWTGSANSWVSLEQFLPGSWSSSTARDIWMSDSRIYVVGSGYSLDRNRTEGIIWSRPVCEPASLIGLLGMSCGYVARRRKKGVPAGSVSRDWLKATRVN